VEQGFYCPSSVRSLELGVLRGPGLSGDREMLLYFPYLNGSSRRAQKAGGGWWRGRGGGEGGEGAQAGAQVCKTERRAYNNRIDECGFLFY